MSGCTTKDQGSIILDIIQMIHHTVSAPKSTKIALQLKSRTSEVTPLLVFILQCSNQHQVLQRECCTCWELLPGCIIKYIFETLSAEICSVPEQHKAPKKKAEKTCFNFQTYGFFKQWKHRVHVCYLEKACLKGTPSCSCHHSTTKKKDWKSPQLRKVVAALFPLD